MKRLFTLQLVIFMAILSVAAQSVTSGQSKVLDAFNPQQLSTTPFQLVKPQIGPDYQFKTSQKSRRANADASTIIRQQPAGTLLDNMITSYGGYTRNWIYGLMDVTTDGGVGKIVEGEDGNIYIPEFGISDSRFSCYARFPTGAYYICPPNNMDGKMQNCKVQMKFTL